jgi:type IV secretion system protein TrbL
VATGLVSGAPQLGAGAVAGTALAVAGGGAAIGAAAAGVGSAVAAGARLAPASTRSAIHGAHTAASTVGGTSRGFQSAAAGLGNFAKAGAQSLGQKVASAAQAIKAGASAAIKPQAPASDAGPTAGVSSTPGDGHPTAQPPWAKRLHRRQQIGHAASTAAHTLRGGDGGGSGPAPNLQAPPNPEEIIHAL